MPRWLSLAAVLILWTAEGSRAEEILHGAGATFPLPLYRQWFELFARETGIRTSYQAVGSGEGIQRLLSRWVDFAATDAFLTSEEMGQAQAAVLHIPTCVGAVTISYNLTEIDELRLTPELLAEILLGHITHWSDLRLADAATGRLPHQKITVVHRSERSGTTFIFTDYLSKTNDTWRRRIGRGTRVAWPVGIGVEGNLGVAQFLARIPGSIGYMESSYAEQDRLPDALLQNRSGRYIAPNLASITAAAEADLPADTRIMLTDTTNPDGYPISGLTYLVIYQEQAYDRRTQAHAKALISFLTWALATGQSYTTQQSYAPLPAGVLQQAQIQLGWATFNRERLLGD